MSRILRILLDPTNDSRLFGAGRSGSGRSAPSARPPLPEQAIKLFLTLAVAPPLFFWAIIGDLSTVPDSARPDYVLRLPEYSPALDWLFGLIGLAASVWAIVSLSRLSGEGRLRPGWISRLFILLFAGLQTAYTLRVFTAGVIGANIGAGIMLLFGTPFLLVLYGVVASWMRPFSSRPYTG